MREEYEKLLKSGMFWEFHPQLSGEWEKDKNEWVIIQNELKKLREKQLYNINEGISKKFIEESLQYIYKNNPPLPVEERKITFTRGCINGKGGVTNPFFNCGDSKCQSCSNMSKIVNKELENQIEEATIFDEIRKEIDRQDQKWGVRNQHPATWFLILNEEIGEAAMEVNDVNHDASKINKEKYRTELIQSCAVLIQMIKNIKDY